MKKILDEGVAIDGILGMMSKDVKAAFLPVRYSIFATGLLQTLLPPTILSSPLLPVMCAAQPPAGTDGNEQYNCNGGLEHCGFCLFLS